MHSASNNTPSIQAHSKRRKATPPPGENAIRRGTYDSTRDRGINYRNRIEELSAELGAANAALGLERIETQRLQQALARGTAPAAAGFSAREVELWDRIQDRDEQITSIVEYVRSL